MKDLINWNNKHLNKLIKLIKTLIVNVMEYLDPWDNIIVLCNYCIMQKTSHLSHCFILTLTLICTLQSVFILVFSTWVWSYWWGNSHILLEWDYVNFEAVLYLLQMYRITKINTEICLKINSAAAMIFFQSVHSFHEDTAW